MYVALLILHVLVCVFLIIVVLLQSGKAADLAGAFGGMGSQTAFGPRGSATLLSKATTISAVIFMLTSLSLSIVATRNAGMSATVLRGIPANSAPAQQSRPAPGGGTTTLPIPAQAPAGQTQTGGNNATFPLPAPAEAPKK